MDYTDCTENPLLFGKCLLARRPACTIIEEDGLTVRLDYNEQRGSQPHNLMVFYGPGLGQKSVFPGTFRREDFPNTWAFMAAAQAATPDTE